MIVSKFCTIASIALLAVANAAYAQVPEMPSVQKELDAKKLKFNETADDAKKSDYEKGIELVKQSGIVEAALQVGDTAPDFTLPDASGTNVQLYDLLKNGPVVLVWYRGGWCPYCNIHLHHLQEALPDFKEAGATLVAISPELPDNSISTKEKNNLDYYVLSDVHNKVGKQYNVVYTLPDFIAERYNEAFELIKYNGDESNQLPLSATYVIAPDGSITYAFLDADYRNRAEPMDLLAALLRMKPE